ncbi:MAG: type III-B CRISPR module RAMP protein Cmr4 [Deltaproteobacteria bacterium]|nr:type III-B CRISPR module RAMP protein Cmr4 [Deltaproteobacteria bacterium]MBW2308579.1 type III-B CRISPR module RAMP protein Cmr4 [Deltaproteobacteria bacterium]
MFPKDLSQICVLYALSPLHAGSGQAIGAVDLPIQRERHTAWPHVQASGVKGAFRDWFQRYYEANAAKCQDKELQAKELTEKVFGKEETGEESGGQAGAISVSDARLLAFPVRSNVAPFVWVTCPEVLRRLKRDLSLCPMDQEVPLCVPEGEDNYLAVIGDVKNDVVLEDLVVKPSEKAPDVAGKLKKVFEDLAPQVTRLLLISDQNFSFLVRTATEVQPHISIDIETGTAGDGSLRYQELLPSDSILYILVFFAKERTNGNKSFWPEIIRDCVTQAISTHIQMGGDMTLGRGLMEVRWLAGNSGKGGSQ